MRPEPKPEIPAKTRPQTVDPGTGRRSYRMPALLDSVVMSLIERSNRALTAYEIARLSADGGSAVSAAQVYRVLDRLAARGAIQRIELLAAYMATHNEQSGFLVCRCCSAVVTFPVSTLTAAVDQLCRAVGFSPSHSLFEVIGLCSDCRRSRAAEAPKTGKARAIMRSMKTLIALMTTAGAFAFAMPADAEERRAGAFYDRTGREIGTVVITDAPNGVLLRIDVRGLPPGWHGMHFHEKGDCSGAAFKAAGSHVHADTPIVHGFLAEGANDAGDLPNLHIDADGNASVELYSTLVSTTGRGDRPALRDFDGSALVIHANPDDYTTQPIGGAGERIACSLIK